MSRKAQAQGFNPCEGFGGFGTVAWLTFPISGKRFNPCEGFGGFGTVFKKVFVPSADQFQSL